MFKNGFDFVGQIIGPGCIDVWTKITDPIPALRHRTTSMELRSVSKLWNYFRRPVLHFVSFAALLKNWLRNGLTQTFDELTESETAVSGTLLTKFVEPSLLILPRLQAHYTVETNACDLQIGCAVLQKRPDGIERPIGHLYGL